MENNTKKHLLLPSLPDKNGKMLEHQYVFWLFSPKESRAQRGQCNETESGPHGKLNNSAKGVPI